jgi:predicted dehydrogenase
MNFALLGIDDDALELARQIVRSRDHQLAVVCDAEAARGELEQLAPRARWGEPWESLLADSSIDAVIVANADASRTADSVFSAEAVVEQQLRKLVQAAIPLVVVHPICGTLTAYEIEMMREEAGGILVPYWHGGRLPAIDRLRELIHDATGSPIGKVEQVLFERHLARRDRDAVLFQFRRDAAWIVRLIGEIDSVNAAGTGDDTYARLNVVLGGSSGVSARWSVQPEMPGDVDRIVVLGEHGKAVWNLTADTQWTIEINGELETLPGEQNWSELNELVAELEGRASLTSGWSAACRDLDLGDQVATSVRRKRTIELHRDEKPEENAFKGIMATGGCLLLVLVGLSLVLLATFEGFRLSFVDRPETPGDTPPTNLFIRLWPVYPLLAFLLLQLLVFVAKRPRPATKEEEGANRR